MLQATVQYVYSVSVPTSWSYVFVCQIHVFVYTYMIVRLINYTVNQVYIQQKFIILQCI